MNTIKSRRKIIQLIGASGTLLSGKLAGVIPELSTFGATNSKGNGKLLDAFEFDDKDKKAHLNFIAKDEKAQAVIKHMKDNGFVLHEDKSKGASVRMIRKYVSGESNDLKTDKVMLDIEAKRGGLVGSDFAIPIDKFEANLEGFFHFRSFGDKVISGYAFWSKSNKNIIHIKEVDSLGKIQDAGTLFKNIDGTMLYRQPGQTDLSIPSLTPNITSESRLVMAKPANQSLSCHDVCGIATSVVCSVACAVVWIYICTSCGAVSAGVCITVCGLVGAAYCGAACYPVPSMVCNWVCG